MPRGSSDPEEAGAAELPSDLEDIEDPEGSPAIPAAAVAARAAGTPRAAAPAGYGDREIWALAWPVILSQVLASAVSLIDIAMLRALPSEAIAAVGFATQYLWLGQSVLFAIGIACVALMARAVGAGAWRRARHALAASLAVAVALGAAFATVTVLLPDRCMALLGADAGVIAIGRSYFQLSLGATALLAVTITLESAFRAVRDTRTPMVLAATVTVVKTVLNYAFIYGELGAPELGLTGAGLATALSQAFGLVLFVAVGTAAGGPVPIRVSLRDLREARGIYGEVLRISLPAVGERLVMNAAMMAYFSLVGIYGSAALAAYTIGVRLLSFSWIPGTGFSVAASTLVGQALGASDPEAASRAAARCLRFALLTSVALGLVFAGVREPLARAFTADATVVRELVPFMLLLALAQPLLALHFTLGGALRGAGDTVTPLLAAALGNWAFRVPLAWLAAHLLELDLLYVWAALIFDHLARSALLGAVFVRGAWRSRVGLEVAARRS